MVFSAEPIARAEDGTTTDAETRVLCKSVLVELASTAEGTRITCGEPEFPILASTACQSIRRQPRRLKCGSPGVASRAVLSVPLLVASASQLRPAALLTLVPPGRHLDG